MGVLNKLAFWKKGDDDFDFDAMAEKEMSGLSQPDPLGLDKKPDALNEKPMFPDNQPAQPFQSDPFSSSPSNLGGFPQAPQPTQPLIPTATSDQREHELINSKLDTIKALLTSLDQRMANLEKSKDQEQKNRLW